MYLKTWRPAERRDGAGPNHLHPRADLRLRLLKLIFKSTSLYGHGPTALLAGAAALETGMTIARLYQMTAKEHAAEELAMALKALASVLQQLPGFENAELMQDVNAPGRFTFIEKWASAQAHADSGRLLPKDAFSQVLALLGEKPQVSTYEIIEGV
ncbi:MAG TPA: antibiotic biosynthesis monooxygenase [Phenylobacterium sp.]|nr:antibiotic biosynthesis monooxygenase [Phenylobacterium sp.]HKT53137.1 antibiotic biosynthesis monooxygenase [Caulobacteraceae bacterium]